MTSNPILLQDICIGIKTAFSSHILVKMRRWIFSLTTTIQDQQAQRLTYKLMMYMVQYILHSQCQRMRSFRRTRYEPNLTFLDNNISNLLAFILYLYCERMSNNIMKVCTKIHLYVELYVDRWNWIKYHLI